MNFLFIVWGIENEKLKAQYITGVAVNYIAYNFNSCKLTLKMRLFSTI